MTEVECKTIKMGGSIGVVIPKEIVEKEGIKPNQAIVIDIRKNVKVKDVFGMFADWKTPTQKLKDEARKGW